MEVHQYIYSMLVQPRKLETKMNLNKNNFSVCTDTGGEYLKTFTNVFSMLNTK